MDEENAPNIATESFPTAKLDPYIEEHCHTNRAEEAHPIDEDIVADVCDTKMGPATMHFDLALVQATALREVLPYNGDTETWVKRDGDLHYLTATSQTFYDIVSLGSYRYDNAYIEVEDLSDIVEAHTRQYLRDVHAYEGDFGGTTATGKEYPRTLCSAQNDAHRLREQEPDGANYAFTDRRGLVIEEGTHPED